MSYLTKPRHLRPYESIIKGLDEIRRGTSRWERTFSAAEDEIGDPLNGAEDDARSYRHHLREDCQYVAFDLAYAEIIEIQRRAEYRVALWLTDDGEAALKALQNGLVWDREEQCIATQNTIDFYDDRLRGHFITDDTFRVVAGLDRFGAEFRPLVSRFVLRKLGSEPAPNRPGEWRLVEAMV
jgi:hypothetical protein